MLLQFFYARSKKLQETSQPSVFIYLFLMLQHGEDVHPAAMCVHAGVLRFCVCAVYFLGETNVIYKRADAAGDPLAAALVKNAEGAFAGTCSSPVIFAESLTRLTVCGHRLYALSHTHAQKRRMLAQIYTYNTYPRINCTSHAQTHTHTHPYYTHAHARAGKAGVYAILIGDEVAGAPLEVFVTPADVRGAAPAIHGAPSALGFIALALLATVLATAAAGGAGGGVAAGG